MTRVLSIEVSSPSTLDRNANLADLKPENILFKSKAEDAELALADFGVGRFIPHQDGIQLIVSYRRYWRRTNSRFSRRLAE